MKTVVLKLAENESEIEIDIFIKKKFEREMGTVDLKWKRKMLKVNT